MSQNTTKEIRLIKKKFDLQYKNGEYQAVIDGAKRVLAMDATDYDTLCTAATASMEIGNNEEALAFATKMLEIKKDYIYGYLVLAKVYYLRLEYDKTIQILEDLLLNYEKQMPNAIRRLVYSFFGNIFNVLGDSSNGCQNFLKASQITEDVNAKIVEYSKYLLSTNYNHDKSDTEIFAEHAKYTELFKKVKQFIHKERTDKEKLNIGYISPDFRYHVVVFFCYELLSRYNKDRFNVICYATGMEDGVTAQLKELVSGWRDISKMNPDEAAKVIYRDDIDILVDLSGHTDNNCLPILARKPAPIQVSGIGYFNTTGLKAVDYFLTDQYCAPLGENDDLFVEKLVRLPHSHLCYTAQADVGDSFIAPVNKNGYITFGSFNHFTKATDAVLLVWKRILERVKDSKLILKSKVFGSVYACEEIKKRLIHLGFQIENVEFRPTSIDYLHQYQDIDIALDTFPYPGGGTTCEALYMGVPVITLVGKRHGSRFGCSLLKNIGLDDYIACNETEYVEKAVILANDKEKLNELHGTLRQKIMDSAVMNGVQYVSEVENAYEEMWEDLLYFNHKNVFHKKLTTKQLEQINQLKIALLDHWNDSDDKQIIKLCKEVLKINPNDYEVLYVLSEKYYGRKELDRAKKFVEKTIALKDDHIKAHYMLGMIYWLRKDNHLYFEKIIEIFNKMVKLDLNHLEPEYLRKAYSILSIIYWDIEDIDNFIKWSKKAYLIANNEKSRLHDYTNYLFGINHSINFDREKIFQAHKKYNEFFSEIILYEHRNIEQKEKLRIGYISPDFCLHPVAFFSFQLLLEYNKEKFEVYCYSNTKRPDAVTDRLKTLVTKWCDIANKTAAEASQMVYEDKIDILVDLSGHTGNSVLPVLAYKPAPIQMSGIGYVTTTGLKTVDYFITDEYCDPKGLNDQFFVERLLRLPHTHFCFTGNSEAPACKKAPSLKNKYITFGSFNKFKKVNAKVLASWAKILNHVPNSKLVIKASAFTTKYGIKLAKEKIVSAGIKEEQVEFRVPSSNYMEEYNDIDIILDTYPFAGGTTTFEALYMGVPVITLVGDHHVSRFGYSILKNLEFEDGIAYNEDEYVEKAVALANDKVKVAELHETLRMRMLSSPLMNGKQYVHDMEKEYKRIWDEVVEMKIKKNNKNKFKTNKSAPDVCAKKIDMTQVNELKQQVLQYRSQGQYEDAMIAISEIFTLEYYGTEVMYDLAEIYYITEDMERAIVWSKKVISFDKNHTEAYLLLAKIYNKENNITELLPILNKLLGKDFENIIRQVETLLEDIYLLDYELQIENKYKNLYRYMQNQKKTVEKVPEQTAETKQQVTKTDFSNLRNLLKKLGSEKLQENTLSEIIHDALENGLTEQAREKIKTEELDKVIDEIAKCTVSDSKKIDLLNEIAVDFYQANHLDQALPLIVKALELDGQNDNSLKNLSFVLFNIGEKDLALQYLEKVSKKDIAVIDLINRIKN